PKGRRYDRFQRNALLPGYQFQRLMPGRFFTVGMKPVQNIRVAAGRAFRTVFVVATTAVHETSNLTALFRDPAVWHVLVGLKTFSQDVSISSEKFHSSLLFPSFNSNFLA